MAGLTPKQEKTIAALMTTATVTDAAKAAGVGERTVYAWLAEPDFSAAYRAARRDAVQQATARLQQVSGAAAGALADLLDNSKAPIRLAAARAILEMAVKAVELDDLQQQLAALAERLAAIEGTHEA